MKNLSDDKIRNICSRVSESHSKLMESEGFQKAWNDSCAKELHKEEGSMFKRKEDRILAPWFVKMVKKYHYENKINLLALRELKTIEETNDLVLEGCSLVSELISRQEQKEQANIDRAETLKDRLYND